MLKICISSHVIKLIINNLGGFMQKEETLLKKLTRYLAIIFAIDMLLFVITYTLTMIFSNSEGLPKIWLSTFYYSSVLRR